MRNIRMLDLNLLRNLDALLEEKHVARAASTLGMTASAMSHALRRLREYFDDPLLVRIDNQYELTPLAEQLKNKAQAFMMEAEGIAATGAFEPSLIDTTFRIQAYDFISINTLIPAIKRMQSIAPNLIFELNSYTNSSLQKLINNEIDLIFGSSHLSHNSLISRAFCEEPIMCILDENHPCLQNWTAKNFFSYPQIVNADPKLRPRTASLSRYLEKHGFKRRVALKTRNPHIRPACLRGTHLIDMQLEGQAKITSGGPGLKILPPPFEIPDFKVNMIWTERNHKDSTHSWIREQFIDLP